MTFKKTLFAVAFGALACAGAVSAASAQPYHPRQTEVLDRAAQQRAMIRHEAATGRMAPAKAHRLLAANRHVVRQEHRLARANGGHLTVAQQRRLNHQENRVGQRIHG
jgi:hypothetical protein